MFVLCFESKDKGRSYDNQDKETCKEEVRRRNKKIPGGGRDFPHPSRPALGLTQPPIQWVAVSFQGVKQSPRSSAQAKERIDLYL